MSADTIALVKAFDSLPPEEKLAFASAIFHRLPPVASGRLDDEEVAAAGDEIAAMLDEEENAAQSR